MRLGQGASSPGTTVATYSYDPASPQGLRRAGGQNRRIRKVVANDDTYDYYYNESHGLRSLGEAGWQVLEVRKGGDTDPLEQYVWGLQYIDAPVVRFRDHTGGEGGTPDGTVDDTLYYMYDGNFNVTALIGTNGTVAERYVYDPYGKVSFLDGSWGALSASAYDNEILYCGYRHDPESGLYQVRYRYLHSTLGRWVTRDQIGYLESVSLFEYCRSSPLTRVDSSGEASNATTQPPKPSVVTALPTATSIEAKIPGPSEPGGFSESNARDLFRATHNAAQFLRTIVRPTDPKKWDTGDFWRPETRTAAQNALVPHWCAHVGCKRAAYKAFFGEDADNENNEVDKKYKAILKLMESGKLAFTSDWPADADRKGILAVRNNAPPIYVNAGSDIVSIATGYIEYTRQNPTSVPGLIVHELVHATGSTMGNEEVRSTVTNPFADNSGKLFSNRGDKVLFDLVGKKDAKTGRSLSLSSADNYRRALEAYVQCRERSIAHPDYDPSSDPSMDESMKQVLDKEEIDKRIRDK